MKRRLRFSDLQAAGLVHNRVTLARWINEHGFPPGQLTGPNSRTWCEAEVEAWLAARPVAPKVTEFSRHRRRERKSIARDEAASA